ncbi:MAG: glycosyltransferase family 4 protein [Flavobacteriales bacterium]
MIELLLPFVASFMVVLVATPSLIKVAKIKHLVDEPSEDRKVHRKSIPTIGGIMIFAGTILSFSLFFPTSRIGELFDVKEAIHHFQYIVGCLFILFFVGTKDDIIGFSPTKKLIAHLLVGSILVFMADIRITSLQGIFGLDGDMPFAISAAFSIFVYIVVVNATNLIDGVDGLAAGVGLIASAAFAVWNFYIGNLPYAILAMSLAGALLGFLVFNFNPAKIFMGDSGSLTIGLIMYVLATGMIEQQGLETFDWASSVCKPVLAMSILAFPLLDTIRVFTLRALKGNSPFSADRNHLHHHLLDLGLGHKKTVLIIYLFSIFIIFLAAFSRVHYPNWSLLVVGLTAFGLTQCLFLYKRSRKA